ncbi:transcriptional regulator [Streptomyces sp. NPDC048057]|uniref:transcriptional regulator n=1 Tax=Streptomyces sp. NPDC048057 TaxID=3155628 RepID=UPI0033F50310
MSPTADEVQGEAGESEVAYFEADTRMYRSQYWTTDPAELLGVLSDHAAQGRKLMTGVGGEQRRTLAVALAESLVLAGRVRLLGLQDPSGADVDFREARESAELGGDPQLAAAAVGHAALVPGWPGAVAATDVLTEARALASRGTPNDHLNAWLDLIEAERVARAGENARALHLVDGAEAVLHAADVATAPAWLDWFTPALLGVFKGRIQLQAGLTAQARRTLLYAMTHLSTEDHGQRSMVYLGLAAIEAAEGEEYEACGYACRSLEHIEVGGDVMGLRSLLDEYLHDPCVQDLYENLPLSPSDPVPPSDITQLTRRTSSTRRTPGIR